MSRPVKRRTVKSYRRDVESLTRLRSALKLDLDIPKKLVEQTCKDIDTLVNSILELMRKIGA